MHARLALQLVDTFAPHTSSPSPAAQHDERGCGMRKANWDGLHVEPTLDVMFDDPVIQTMMARDGVDPDELRALCAVVSRRLNRPVARSANALPERARADCAC